MHKNTGTLFKKNNFIYFIKKKTNYQDFKFKTGSNNGKPATHIHLLMWWRTSPSSAKPLFTYLPSARLMERKMGYSSGAGWPCWSSYRKMGPRPTSTPSCWMPCWLYMDNRKDWRPALGLMVNMMEKSCGKTPPAGQITSVDWHTLVGWKNVCRDLKHWFELWISNLIQLYVLGKSVKSRYKLESCQILVDFKTVGTREQ